MSKLEMVVMIGSEEFHDADMIPMSEWSEDKPLPCFYVGSYEDSFDFLDPDNEMRKDQEEQPQRWWFMFNRVPKNYDEIINCLKRSL